MEFQISDRMSTLKGSAIREMFKAMADPSMISLAGGNPSAELFPNKELAEIARDILENDPVGALQYGISEGNIALRKKILEMMEQRENIHASLDEITIVSGGQQAIEISSKILLNEGDYVLVEEPSFVGALNAFRSYGAKLKGIEVKEDGIDVDALKKALDETPNVKIIYTIPNFQNPSGITMSEEKRRAVYEAAREHGVFIIEDNPYGELTFDGVKLPTIKSMDKDGIVLYSGSFSKILAPGLRLGYLIAPKNFTEKAVLGKQVSDVHTALLPQLLALHFLEKYDIGALIEKMRSLYSRKCSAMLEAIDKYLPASVSHTTPRGGLFVWCDAPGVDTLKLSKDCIKEKVLIVPGNNFAVDMSKPNSGFRLNFSTMSDELIVEGVKRLGKVLNG